MKESGFQSITFEQYSSDSVQSKLVTLNTWIHQYQIVEAQVRLRAAKNISPAGERMDSPYDPDARLGSKRSTT